MYRHLKLLFICIVAVFICSFASSAVASPFLFTRDLAPGDTGTDVYELQKFLNKNESTFVAMSGPGSAGNETNYFGPATQAGVIKFQNEHASEILVPQGSFSANGLVDSLTRAKLNEISAPQIESTTDTTNTGTPTHAGRMSAPHTQRSTQDLSDVTQFNLFTDKDNDKVRLAFISSSAGKVGSEIDFTGTGFLPINNRIIFGSHTVSGVDSVNSNKIKFTIPDSIPAGIYDVEVGNTKGTSQSNAYFVVTEDAVNMPPKILSVSPAEPSLGDEVVITGENFTTSGNTVRSTLGVFTNLPSSDGKTIKFNLKAPDNLPEFETLFQDSSFEFKVFLYVVNIHGVSEKNKPGIITLK